jgi:glycerol kinase
MISERTGLSVTNQRETTIVWDRETSKPIQRHSLARSSTEYCDKLKEGYAEMIQKKTG